MIRSFLLLMVSATPLAAQPTSLTFENGKAVSLAPGQWSYVVTAKGGEARYGTHLLLGCDRASRTMTISRPTIPAGTATVITDMLTRSLPPNGRVAASDPILDAMAFSRGRILIAGGGSVLAVPSWPEAARAIEDCRN